MPAVDGHITQGAERQQRARPVQETADSLVEALGKRPTRIRVTTEEIAAQNWGYAGMPTHAYRARAATDGE